MPLHELDTTIMPRKHLITAQGHTSVLIDFKVQIEAQKIKKLIEESAIWALSEVCKATSNDEMVIREQRQEESAGWQLSNQINQEFQHPFQVSPQFEFKLAICRDCGQLLKEDLE
mmetsp:Transcript_33135/g.104797  ORF Transcript_33135/g.104797 Transcript_33135/m.104797 type:complete len:115 (-) Transcript_33135:1450-1794(-)